jgi:hypothetical protein
MYSNNTYEPSERELQWARERTEEKERKEKAKREKEYRETIGRLVNNISRHGNAKVKSSGELCDIWYCPRCNRWFHAYYESSHDGVTETSCTRCGERLAHAYGLEKEEV